MNHLYLALGRAIAGLCPPGFEQAVMKVDLEEGRSLPRITATQTDGWEVEVPTSEEQAQHILGTLGAIQHAMAKEDPRTWKGATVTLKKGGHFDLDVAY